jgi:hypothetical protein
LKVNHYLETLSRTLLKAAGQQVVNGESEVLRRESKSGDREIQDKAELFSEYAAVRIRSQLAKWAAPHVFDRNSFNFSGQFFAGLVAIEMNSQDIVSRFVFLDTDTRHARYTEQACRMPLFYFTYFLFGSYGLPPLTPHI